MIDEPVPDWDGHERRNIPFQLITFMDEKVRGVLQEALGETRRVIEAHAEDDTRRYEAILKSLNDHRDETERRFENLFRSIDAYTTAAEALHNDMKDAFPKDEDGKPDFRGHNRDHKFRMENAEKHEQLMAYVKKQMENDKNNAEDRRFIKRAVIGGIVTVFVLWAAKALWYDAVRTGLPQTTTVQQGTK